VKREEASTTPEKDEKAEKAEKAKRRKKKKIPNRRREKE
jgi:hypothetical protein